jgi:hypothetical protein
MIVLTILVSIPASIFCKLGEDTPEIAVTLL